jgi:hypothetical protein
VREFVHQQQDLRGDAGNANKPQGIGFKVREFVKQQRAAKPHTEPQGIGTKVKEFVHQQQDLRGDAGNANKPQGIGFKVREFVKQQRAAKPPTEPQGIGSKVKEFVHQQVDPSVIEDPSGGVVIAPEPFPLQPHPPISPEEREKLLQSKGRTPGGPKMAVPVPSQPSDPRGSRGIGSKVKEFVHQQQDLRGDAGNANKPRGIGPKVREFVHQQQDKRGTGIPIGTPTPPVPPVEGPPVPVIPKEFPDPPWFVGVHPERGRPDINPSPPVEVIPPDAGPLSIGPQAGNLPLMDIEIPPQFTGTGESHRRFWLIPREGPETLHQR